MYDVIVIGSGPGGYVAAVRAAQLGLQTAVVERAQLGGVCLNWGCIPTKALLKSAEALRTAQHAASYGLAPIAPDGGTPSACPLVPDIKAIVERSRAVSAQMSKGIEFLFKKHGVTLIAARGRIVGPGQVGVTYITPNDGPTVLEAKHIIIATGSRSNSLPFAPIDGKKIIGYRQALVPERIPESMAVIGSGAIGSELGYFYHTLGTKVTIIEYMDNLVPLEDEDVSAQLSRSFRKEGIKVMTSAGVQSADKSGEGVVLQVQTKKGMETVEAQVVLSAVGVVPNTNDMGLEEAGVVLERGKIKVDANYQTTVPGIYAIGDVIATPALAHVASAEAICCVERIAGHQVPDVNYGNIPGCYYTSPEIASVGLNEKAARAKGIAIKIGKYLFTASGKAATAGERDGFVKLIFDAQTEKLLGAHLIGAHVTEMIGGLVAARNLGVTARDLAYSVFPHPTMSEGIMEAASAALE